MNNGNNGRNSFNFSGFGNFFKRQEAAAKAAATRRSRMAAAPSRSQPRRGQAATSENLNMGAAAAASNWGGEGVPIYGTNYSVARSANERPPRAVSRRSKAPAPTRGRNRSYTRNNERRRRNERSRSRSRERATTTRRNNNRNRKPASEFVAPGKKKSLYDQAVYIVEKQAEPLAANNTKRGYQLSHYERQLGEFTEFLRSNPYNVHNGVISDAIAVLQRKLGRSSNLPAFTGANANANMGASSSSSASASASTNNSANSLPPGIFPKDRTIDELLKIRDYMERRAAAAGSANARNRRANGAKSQNFRRFLGLLYESANYHIGQLDPANDSIDALHLHSGKQFLDELAQNLDGTPARAPTPQQQEEANELIDELADALAGTSMGPATFRNNNL